MEGNETHSNAGSRINVRPKPPKCFPSRDLILGDNEPESDYDAAKDMNFCALNMA